MEYNDVRMKRMAEILQMLVNTEGNEFAYATAQTMQQVPARIFFRKLLAQLEEIKAFMEYLEYIETGKRLNKDGVTNK